MNNVKIELDKKAINELLHDDAIYGVCEEVARNIADSTSGKFYVERANGKNRSWATILSNDDETKQEQLKNSPNIYDKVWSGGR